MKSSLGALLMITMGCAPVPPPEPAEEDVPVHGETGRRCDASRAQSLVGRSSSTELGAEAMRLTGAGTLRWIPKGGVVTMEYREDRVNIELDGQNKVVRVRCG